MVQILPHFGIDLLQYIAVNCNFGTVNRIAKQKLTDYTFAVEKFLNLLLLPGIVNQNDSDDCLLS